MITKDFENDFNLECDVCGFECEEVFESFTEVVEWKQDNAKNEGAGNGKV